MAKNKRKSVQEVKKRNLKIYQIGRPTQKNNVSGKDFIITVAVDDHNGAGYTIKHPVDDNKPRIAIAKAVDNYFSGRNSIDIDSELKLIDMNDDLNEYFSVISSIGNKISIDLMTDNFYQPFSEGVIKKFKSFLFDVAYLNIRKITMREIIV